MSDKDDMNYQPKRLRGDEAADEITETDAPETEAPEMPETPETPEAPETPETGAPDAQNAKQKALAEDSFDYVVPAVTFREENRRRHKKKHHSKKPAEIEGQENKDIEYVFAKPARRSKFRRKKIRRRRRKGLKKLPRWKRILIIVLIVLLALITALAGTFLILREIGRNSLKADDSITVSVPAEDESGNDVVLVDNSGRVITYDGVTYELNESLISLTFIGIDEGSDGTTQTPLQMADAIYILAFDPVTGKSKILSISRDTMADVDLYSDQGKYIDTQRMQMAFSYAYGSDEVTGGKNTNTSLMRLFYGLPFNNYFAINMDALITLNDAVGGVTLTSSMTFVSPVDGRTINEGETVTLHGKEADYYVRNRDTEKLDSNNSRMQRQQEYIRAFLQSVIPAVKGDISVVSKLYDAIASNSDTTLDLPKMTYIASAAAMKLRDASDIEYLSLKGTITEGEFAELNVSDEEAIRTMLNVFYTPLAKVPDGIKN